MKGVVFHSIQEIQWELNRRGPPYLERFKVWHSLWGSEITVDLTMDWMSPSAPHEVLMCVEIFGCSLSHSSQPTKGTDFSISLFLGLKV